MTATSLQSRHTENKPVEVRTYLEHVQEDRHTLRQKATLVDQHAAEVEAAAVLTRAVDGDELYTTSEGNDYTRRHEWLW